MVNVKLLEWEGELAALRMPTSSRPQVTGGGKEVFKELSKSWLTSSSYLPNEAT